MATQAMKCNSVNHQFLASSFKFCHECGIGLQGQSSELVAALITVKDKALLAIPSAIGFTQGDLQEIADVAQAALKAARQQ